MSHPWAKVHKILGGEGLRWQSIIVPTHPTKYNNGDQIKWAKIWFGAQGKRSPTIVAFNSRSGRLWARKKTNLEKQHYFIWGVTTSPCLFKKAPFFVKGQTLLISHQSSMYLCSFLPPQFLHISFNALSPHPPLSCIPSIPSLCI